MGTIIMIKNEKYNNYSGKVSAAYRTKTGREHLALENHNTITYKAATVMSHILSGNELYRPLYMGFVYAPAGSTFSDPGDPRLRTMATIRDAMESQGGNMIISPLQSGKNFETSGNTEYYFENAVTFNAVSDPNAELAFSGGNFSTALPTAGSDNYFQCVLLSDPKQGIVEDMIPYAIANLTASGLPAQSGLEMAIYWTITFK